MKNYLIKLDHDISSKMHQLDNQILTIILYPFAAFFHPKLIWIAYFLVLQFSNGNYKLTIVYSGGTLVCLICTYLLKKFWNRARPIWIKSLKKSDTFRKKQKNNSMPSGDALQSAFFVTVLYYLNVRLDLLILFHCGVCLGRVYFLCHWFLDTIVATVLGVIIGYLFSISLPSSIPLLDFL